MRTRHVTTIELDPARLAKDLEQSESFRYSEAYSDYLIGGPWKNATLWARGGNAGDGVLTDYIRPCLDVHRVRGTVAVSAGGDHWNGRHHPPELVRLARISNSVIVPHRDFLELGDIPQDSRSAHRLHIPVAGHARGLFLQRGQHRVPHACRRSLVLRRVADPFGCLTEERGADPPHLRLRRRPGAGPLVTVADDGGHGIPADRAVSRPPLSDKDNARLHRLAELLTMDTIGEVLSIIIKYHFRYDGGDDLSGTPLRAIAGACADPAVLPHTLELHRYYTLERSA